MKTKKLFILLSVLILSSNIVFAEDFTKVDESEMFSKSTDKDADAVAEKEKAAEQENFLKEKLAIGGSLYSDLIYSVYENQRFKNNVLTNPNLLWVYMDGKFAKDVRVFIRGRVLYNPTLNETQTSPLTGLTYQKTQASLDELKIMFNTNNKVFFTVGKQKIKYGSARIWNPTDFLNTVMRDPFYSYDRREGINLIKVHMPINASNLYLIGSLDNASNLDKVGYYLRYELPLTSSSEFAISMISKNNTATKLGIDFSTAFFGFDIYAETSIAKGTDITRYSLSSYVPELYNPYADKKTYFCKTSAGISYEMQYGENDSMTFNAEYYYNGEGYSNSAVYPTLFYNHSLNFFNLGRDYGMLMLYIPKPGTWNTYTFTVFNITNISDQSSILRAQAMKQFTNDLSLGFNITGHYGKPSGEFKLYSQMLDFGLRMEMAF